MASNFNDTTPAAPAGASNVKWQKDGSGNISANVPTSPIDLVDVDLTAQAADIAATTLFAIVTSARYRVSGYIIVTQAATTSSVLPSIVISWTDPDNSTVQSLTLTPTNSGNLLTSLQQANAILSAKAVTNAQYSTSGYASVGATPMQFALHLVLESL